MVPAPVTAMKNMSALDPNGIITVYDMAEKENLKLYKDPKYWNNDLRDEFMSETRGLWATTHESKYVGRIFNARGPAPVDFQRVFTRVDKEMDAAIEKHGVCTPPSSYIDEVHDRVDKNKRDIVNQAHA